MTRTIELTTTIDASPDEVTRHVMTPRLLDHVASPMIEFGYPPSFDRNADWPLGEHHVTMRLFGVLPIGWQAIGIEIPESPDPDVTLLRDNGHSPLIKRWDHWISIRPHPSGRGTLYTDRVHIEAGLLTLFVTAYARLFYAHRQKRWRALAASDFAALR
ncbi:MAG: hypothetical protein ACX930_13600 [Erythrobacter sp.]